MKIINKIITKLLLLITLIFSVNIKVEALVEVGGGGSSLGSNSICGYENGYFACYYPRFQYRVSLVEQKSDGQIIKVKKRDESGNFTNEDTDSIDIGFTMDNKTKIISKGNVNLVNDNYKYKYGINNYSNFKYINLYVDSNEFEDVYASYKNIATGMDDPNNYEAFTNYFMKLVINRVKESKTFAFDTSTYKNENTDFLSLFLKYAGYTNEYNIDDDTIGIKNIKNLNYFLLFEPTYDIEYNETPFGTKIKAYGTGTEIVEFMKNKIESNKSNYIYNGYFAGLSSNFIYQTGCNLHTTPLQAQKMNYNYITEETDCSEGTATDRKLGYYSLNFEPRESRLQMMEKVINQNSGYGVYVLRLDQIGNIKEPAEENYNLNVNVNLCQGDQQQGIITSNIDSDGSGNGLVNENIKEAIKKDYFYISGDNNKTKLYCYDDVRYDFSNIINLVKISDNNTGLKPNTIFDNDYIMNATSDGTAGNLRVTRTCYAELTQYTSKADAKNFDKYKNNKISINIFGENLDFKIDGSDIIESSKDGWLTYTYTANYILKDELEITNEMLENSSTGYIKFNNASEMFGYNEKIISELNKKPNNRIEDTFTQKETTKNITYIINYENNQKDATMLCPFETTSETKGKEIKERIKFRTISLSNPFPARDGTSRLPGSNWLDKKNYVYDYITNNRGVEADEIYNKEPIYSITLTPSLMRKIRKYNKDNHYNFNNISSKNMLNIVYDTNAGYMKESNFLKELGNEVTGTCVGVSHNDPNGLTKCAVQNETGTYCYDDMYKGFDKNKDKIITLDELEDIPYYSCADKTAVSGGY